MRNTNNVILYVLNIKKMKKKNEVKYLELENNYFKPRM